MTSFKEWLQREYVSRLAEEGRRVSRSKSKFSSATKAWADIAKATGKTPKDVLRKDHTATEWAWILKK